MPLNNNLSCAIIPVYGSWAKARRTAKSLFGPFRHWRRREVMSEIEGLTDVTLTSRFGSD